ncbi:hypothetical protein ESOMN_v1c04870 [Williamsoniiplasma somnilux]|uniref:Uncharacterized protein n=1 Tax=Williamsoniiplasma somnilux TaxID=215578 RepID=A0A2K8NYH5_9MOLU|nr:hypothetical protein [Williamsoniiplasma somnilux]ATZ18869.1 hypothetical protein ESOMN_v1c04870 [Williamsoniiplasma somnilux]
MNLNFFVGFGPNGQLGTNFGEPNVQVMLVGVILAIVWGILSGMFAYYLYKFIKSEYKARIIGIPFISIISILSTLLLIDWILIVVFYSEALNIFGAKGPDTAFKVIISLAAIGFVDLLSMVILMWFFISKFGIVMDDSQIQFLGESIAYDKISKVILDESKSAVYIFYSQGKRSKKRQKFKTTSVSGQFIIKNISLSGKELSKGNADEYFKNMEV